MLIFAPHAEEEYLRMANSLERKKIAQQERCERVTQQFVTFFNRGKLLISVK